MEPGQIQRLAQRGSHHEREGDSVVRLDEEDDQIVRVEEAQEGLSFPLAQRTAGTQMVRVTQDSRMATERLEPLSENTRPPNDDILIQTQREPVQPPEYAIATTRPRAVSHQTQRPPVAKTTVVAKKDESETDEEADIILWEVDYGDQESYSGVPFTAKVRVEGIHVLLINDHEQTFSPILQMNVEKFKVVVENSIESLKGSTDIRMLMRYYNNQLDAWEPFLERTSLDLQIE